jgi:hypothetical protein
LPTVERTVDEERAMNTVNRLSRESFLFLARMAGLNTEDPHIEKLFAYLQEVLPKLSARESDGQAPTGTEGTDLHTYIVRYLPKLKPFDGLDLANLDPEMVFRPRPGRKHE